MTEPSSPIETHLAGLGRGQGHWQAGHFPAERPGDDINGAALSK